MWAFGHTHFDCQFYEQDVMSGKNMLVLANQKGYASPGGRTGKIEAVVVESGVDEWKVIMGAKESKIQESRANRRTPEDAVSERAAKGHGDGSPGDVSGRRGQSAPIELADVRASAWRSAGVKIRKMLRPV